MRTALLFISLAAVLACGAWRAHAGATELSFTSDFPPMPAPTSPRKVDEYGNLRWSDERARLDNVAIELRNDPAAVAYLYCYGGRRSYEGEARGRCARAARYLKAAAGIEASHVVTKVGGFREELTVEVWMLPPDADPPTVTPTVDPAEATVIRRRGARKARRR